MSANFSPEMEGYSGIQPFRFWCQKVLPLTYDDSLSYYELLCKVVDYLNNTIEDLSATETNVEALKTAYDELEAYVNSYFDNLDLQEEVNIKLDEMADDGTLAEILAPMLNTFRSEVNVRLAGQDSDITTLEARMDTFASLPDGSTSGDAELLDIRVAADGTIYESAGDAVRGQIENVESDYDSISGVYINLFDPSYILNATGASRDGNEYSATAGYLAQAYGSESDGYPIVGIKANTPYCISFTAYTDGNQATNGRGLTVTATYTDNTYSRVEFLNTDSSYTKRYINTNGKTISKITFGYGQNSSNVWHIKNAIVAEGDAEVEYVPYRIANDIKARRAISDLEESYSSLIGENKGVYDSYPDFTNKTFAPDGFTWTDNPISDKIYTDGVSKFYVDLDMSQYDPTSGGTTYYVSTAGNDANTGLSKNSPLRKISTAYEKSDCSCIMLDDGIYGLYEGLYGVTIGKNLAIKAINKGKALVTTHSDTTFTEYSGNVYSGNRSGCLRVVDTKYKNKYGDFLAYAHVSTVDEVTNTAGSWVIISGVMYIHCADNREPDNKLILEAARNNVKAAGNIKLYLEGLKVMGGYTPVAFNSNSSSDNAIFAAVDCDFLYSADTTYDAVMLKGIKLSVIKNCRAMYSLKDGFNYHAYNNIVPKAIEIGCTGALCGNTDDSNDQGSTIHDGGSIIRVGCTYFGNQGANVSDEASESWNLGCVVYDSLASNTGQQANFLLLEDTSMWLESCSLYGKAHYQIISYTDGTEVLKLRNTKIDGAENSKIYGITPQYY